MIIFLSTLTLSGVLQTVCCNGDTQTQEPSLKMCEKIKHETHMQNTSMSLKWSHYTKSFNHSCYLCLFPGDISQDSETILLDRINEVPYMLSELAQTSDKDDQQLVGKLINVSELYWCHSHDEEILKIHETINQNLRINDSLGYIEPLQIISIECVNALDPRCPKSNETSILEYQINSNQTLLLEITVAGGEPNRSLHESLASLPKPEETSRQPSPIDETISAHAHCPKNTVKKCCPQSSIYDYNVNSCTYLEEFQWEPFMNVSSELQQNLSILYGFPNCNDVFALQPRLNPNHSFSLNADGTVYVPHYKESFTCENICLDFFRSKNETEEEALLCFPEKRDSCSFLKSRLYPILLIVSCVFLLLTILVYALLSELNSKLNGKCVILSTATLFLGYICFIVMAWKNNPSQLYCPLLGLFSQFFLLSSFFWLNVMCFDVWRAFRVPRWEAGKSRSKTARLIKYCIYAWGAPLLITITTGLIHFLVPHQKIGGKVVLPGFGSSGCFFAKEDSRAWWAYFYGFISILLIMDLFFFAHLLILLYREKTATATLRTSPRNIIWVKLYFKLFVIMGVPWIFEVISWVEGSCSIWIWADSFNALRGLLVFVIFVCKRSIWKKLTNQSLVLTSFRSSTTHRKVTPKKTSKFYVDLQV